MRRVLSVWFPSWSVDLARRRLARSATGRAHAADERPILLVEVRAGRTLVVHASRSAHERGVRPGMPLAEARPLLHPAEPAVEDDAPERDLCRLQRVGLWAMRFSPIVALDPPDGLLLDIAGSERLFGHEADLLGSIADAVQRLGFGVRLAAAGTVGTAWAVARFGPEASACIPFGEERAALAPLPVEALRLVDTVVENLRELGITSVEKLLALPRRKLASRFGEELLLRVDQALGRIAEPVQRLEWQAPRVVERVFDGLVTSLEVLGESVRQLLAALLFRLKADGLGATEVQLRLAPSDLPVRVHTLAASRPTQDLTLFVALALPRLEDTDLGFGIERVAVEATAASPMQARQDARWDTTSSGRTRDAASERELSALLDLFSSRLAPDQLLQPRAHESHVPERAFASTPFAAAHETRRERPAGVTAADRPSLLLPRPEPLTLPASTPPGAPSAAAGPPASFAVRGRTFDVVASLGPERIESPWWEGERYARDYFRVETSEERTLWIYRELRVDGARWFLHGEWA